MEQNPQSYVPHHITTLHIPVLDGSQLICKAGNIFDCIDQDFVRSGLDKPDVATPEANIDVYDMVGHGTLRGLFQALPGNWNDKWISQGQLVECCKHSKWLENATAFFLIKRDKDQEVDENYPDRNISVVSVHAGAVFLLRLGPFEVKQYNEIKNLLILPSY